LFRSLYAEAESLSTVLLVLFFESAPAAAAGAAAVLACFLCFFDFFLLFPESSSSFLRWNEETKLTRIIDKTIRIIIF